MPAAVQAAEQEKPKLSKAVATPLAAAQKAMAAKQWDAALAEIKKAQSVEKRTPAEDYQIDEFLGYILVQQKKYGQAAPVFERMLNSGLVPADQVNDRTKAVAQMYFQEKDYRKSSEWAKKWLAKNPASEDMSVLLGQANYLLEDYKGAATVMSGVVANAEKAGQVPKENYIQIVLSSQFKLDNKDGVAEALKKMVRYHPKPEYWDQLTDVYRRKQNGDRVTLGYYRLMSDVGALKAKGDYVEMSQLAIEAGVPGEAEQTMQKGMDSGVLKTDDKTEQGRFTRLYDAAKKQATADRASLAQQAKEAEKAPQGQASVGLGQAYISYGMYDEAIAAIQAGIKKGGVTDLDEAQVSLGLAQMKKGQKDAARQSFKAVKADGKWADLASLWTLRTYS
ncbi:tetratricopeptide repeat protein [Povalibacter sp.]|uniref:tetratricopeptide repeat protein n=1 Tax=Povalibacter sp. TaxID=1962978 RepID=UPI002F412C9D